MQNDKLRSYLHFHFIVLIWGFTAVLGALISIGSVPLVWHRMLLASIAIFLFVKWKGISIRIDRKTFFGLGIAGIVIALHWLTFFGAIKVSNASVTLAIMSTGAFFTSIMEPIFYKRKFVWYELFFGLLVIAGLYLIFQVETQFTYGIILALISAFLSAVFTLINGKYAKTHNPVTISLYELSIGVLFVTVYLFVRGELVVDLFVLSKMDWLYIGILATICTAYAFIASVKVMKYLSPYTIMLTINMEPVYGILLAFLILGENEKLGPGFYVGALVILSTVLLNGILKNSSRRKRKKALGRLS